MMMNSRALLICLFLFVMCIVSTYAAAEGPIGSKWTSPSGNSYDFTRGKKHSVTIDDYTHLFSWAHSYTDSAGCAGTGCITFNGKSVATTAFWEGNKGPFNILETSPGELVIQFNNGQRANGGSYDFDVLATCGSHGTEDTDNGSNSMTVTSPAACPVSDDGLSGGAIFLIIIFSLWAAYFVIGFLVCKFYFKRATITDSIPHLAFWVALPGFYISGCKIAIGFVQSKISGAKNNAGSVDSESYGSTEEV